VNFILDTNVISELVAARPNLKIIEWIQATDADRIFLSVISIGEIKKGIEKLPNSDRIVLLDHWLQEDLLAQFTDQILSIDVQTMLIWGKLVAQLEKLGRPISSIDALLAATAQQWGFTLVTRNIVHFQDIGINLLNPWGKVE
jgi:toxin FitB